jgi:hypothetical protein
MAKTSGGVRSGGRQNNLTTSVNQRINEYNITGEGGTERQYENVRKDIYKSNDERYERLVKRVGEEQAKQELREGGARLLERNIAQANKNDIKSSQKVLDNPNSSDFEKKVARADLKGAKENLYEARANLQWLKERIL